VWDDDSLHTSIWDTTTSTVPSPPCGMMTHTKAGQSLTKISSSKPTVWDGDDGGVEWDN